MPSTTTTTASARTSLLVTWMYLIILLSDISREPNHCQGFPLSTIVTPTATNKIRSNPPLLLSSTRLSSSNNDSSSSSIRNNKNDKSDLFDNEELLRRARAALQKSKEKLAKLRSQNADGSDGSESTTKNEQQSAVPFFASNAASQSPSSSSISKRDMVVKTINEKTGLITTDGEKMAALSEQEQWERRSLLDVFENQVDENEDVYSALSQQLAERDVVASIRNLRMSMHDEDYRKIFDSKNYFIGEDN